MDRSMFFFAAAALPQGFAYVRLELHANVAWGPIPQDQNGTPATSPVSVVGRAGYMHATSSVLACWSSDMGDCLPASLRESASLVPRAWHPRVFVFCLLGHGTVLVLGQPNRAPPSTPIHPCFGSFQALHLNRAPRSSTGRGAITSMPQCCLPAEPAQLLSSALLAELACLIGRQNGASGTSRASAEYS